MSGAAWPSWLDEPLARGLSMRAHALLLHAPGALGQFDLALELSRAWLCEAPANGRACGHCAACRLMDAHSHPDFHLLLPDALRAPLGWSSSNDAEAGKDGEGGEGKTKAKPSREIKIDALRAAIDWSQRTSARGGAKVLVIHPAPAMNAVTANALLKTLEEPPGRLRLLLTADDPEALLPTVRSRCQRLPIAPPSDAAGGTWLAGQGVAEADVLLAAAGGQVQAALALHGEGIDAAAWSQVPDAVRRGHTGALAAWPVPRVVDALHKLCHDLSVLHCGGVPRFFTTAALAPALRPALPLLPALVAWQRELLRAARHDEHPWHAPLRVEALVAQAAALWQTARVATPARGGALATLPGR
jgi:DNA polymerase III subunit delta'